jgi:hypothetical protein
MFGQTIGGWLDVVLACCGAVTLVSWHRVMCALGISPALRNESYLTLGRKRGDKLCWRTHHEFLPMTLLKVDEFE